MTKSWRVVAFYLILTPASCDWNVGAVVNDDMPYTPELIKEHEPNRGVVVVLVAVVQAASE